MAAGATLFGCEGQSLSPKEKQFFRDADPWGFILFARNLDTQVQIRALTAQLRACVGRNAPILIDQEGGRVARLRGPEWRDWLPPLDHMRQVGPAKAARAMWLRYRIIAAELQDIGIDVNCAPMADVPTKQVHDIIRNRCYGLDVEAVVAAARGVAEGLLAGGVLPILKHIPGHGRPVADSHQELPVTDASAKALQGVDFAAFKGLNDLPMGMTAHVVYSAIDPNACATLSPRMIDVIRQDIGFGGLLMTDDISMSALSGSLTDNVNAALGAGCDMILHCNGFLDEMVEVAGAAGNLAGLAAVRADAALNCRQTPQDFDTVRALAELDSLSMVATNG